MLIVGWGILGSFLDAPIGPKHIPLTGIAALAESCLGPLAMVMVPSLMLVFIITRDDWK